MFIQKPVSVLPLFIKGNICEEKAQKIGYFMKGLSSSEPTRELLIEKYHHNKEGLLILISGCVGNALDRIKIFCEELAGPKGAMDQYLVNVYNYCSVLGDSEAEEFLKKTQKQKNFGYHALSDQLTSAWD